jgi:hypothetical protein
VAAAVWAPVEGVLLWLTTASVTTPFGVTPVIDAFPDGWPAVPAATVLGAVTVASTRFGVAVVRRAAAGGRSDVVVADSRGVRTERLSGKGSRVVAEHPWERVRSAELDSASLRVRLESGGVWTGISPAGTAEQHREIAAYLIERLAERPADTPPQVKGWTAWYDDRGPTLQENRRDRRIRAWQSAGAAAVAGANTAAVVAATPSYPLWWFVVFVGGLTTAFLVAFSADQAVRPPRWIARPGNVVMERQGPGQGFTVEALSLVHTTITYEDGHRDETHLDARVDVAGDGGRFLIMSGSGLDSRPYELGTWLARHADIPLHSRHKRVEAPPSS